MTALMRIVATPDEVHVADAPAIVGCAVTRGGARISAVTPAGVELSLGSPRFVVTEPPPVDVREALTRGWVPTADDVKRLRRVLRRYAAAEVARAMIASSEAPK